MRIFERTEIERMVREHPEASRIEEIRDSALRALAEAVNRGRRLLSTREVSKVTGVDRRTLGGWLKAGRIPSARFVHGVLPGAGGAWLIEAGDLETVRAIRDGRSAARAAEVAGRRDPLSGSFLRSGEIPSPTVRCTLRVVPLAEALSRVGPREGLGARGGPSRDPLVGVSS